MDEYDKILYDLGYYASDPLKKEQIKRYVSEAEEFMYEAGVPKCKVTSRRAYAVKSLWADARDKGTALHLVSKDSMIVHLIAQMK
ncbi:MAG: hypothetical protein HPY96_00660 [Bacilli bacterium]|nr:hypothetical protein [Bacilli bacterium]DAV15286.1 MAG TPA: POTRA domain, ShlB-type [Caudoviricetes sp.]